MTQQTKVWAMYDGPKCPADITKGKWYEVSESSTGFYLINNTGYKIYACWFNSIHIGGDNWQRHVGPTPPDTQETALQQLADMGQAFDAAPRFAVSVVKEDLPKEYAGANDKAAPDADGWITHDGSAKRPKGVGKRDRIEIEWVLGGQAYKAKVKKPNGVRWQYVTRYRITKRAEKRRKVWLVYGPYGFEVFAGECGEALARGYMKVNGSKLYTAKLTEVTK